MMPGELVLSGHRPFARRDTEWGMSCWPGGSADHVVVQIRPLRVTPLLQPESLTVPPVEAARSGDRDRRRARPVIALAGQLRGRNHWPTITSSSICAALAKDTQSPLLRGQRASHDRSLRQPPSWPITQTQKLRTESSALRSAHHAWAISSAAPTTAHESNSSDPAKRTTLTLSP